MSNISIKHRLELFDKLVLPILNYGCEVGVFHTANILSVFIHSIVKNILSVKRSTQSKFVYGELARIPLFVGINFRISKYWFKIIESPDHKYVNIVYRILRNDREVFPNKKNWANLLRDIKSSLGFYDAMVFQGVGNK